MYYRPTQTETRRTEKQTQEETGVSPKKVQQGGAVIEGRGSLLGFQHAKRRYITDNRFNNNI